ncbi:MAG: UDP-N-acetylglucosamine 2-epimerase (non-hydrolyzing), partial [Gammaproteobacteria bacterium]|nr:UDP-N-acetylglucosamine 2-epimerase (non-hydrolyzing) [Gammaproteobacteria bacterium]
LHKTKEIFQRINPCMVLVQGDTTSTMAAALSAFYLGIPVGHVEAGLRTDDILSPFPEEMNRRVVGTIASLHFAPTAHAAGQLLGEGVDRSKVFCTGNTVVDALRIIRGSIDSGAICVSETISHRVEQCKRNGKKIMLLTAHRRESFQGGIARVLQATKQFLTDHPDVFCFYPYHPNPCVVQAIHDVGLSHLNNIHLCEPLAYKELAYLLLHVDWVMTDSGGIQEEAVSLGKPVLVLREKTERAEGVWSGLATMVGTDSEKIAKHLQNLVDAVHVVAEKEMQVYGDGYAAEKIVNIVAEVLNPEIRGAQVVMKEQKMSGAVAAELHVEKNMTALNNHAVRALVSASAIAFCRLPPWTYWHTTFAGSSFTATMRVVDRVHCNAAHSRTNTSPAVRACLTDLPKVILFITHFANRCPALDMNAAYLA